MSQDNQAAKNKPFEITEETVKVINAAEDTAKRNIALTIQEFQGMVPPGLIAQIFLNQIAVLMITVMVDQKMTKEEATSAWNEITQNTTNLVFEKSFDDIVASINESIEQLRQQIAQAEEQNSKQEA